jgi:hypothetical protein
VGYATRKTKQRAKEQLQSSGLKKKTQDMEQDEYITFAVPKKTRFGEICLVAVMACVCLVAGLFAAFLVGCGLAFGLADEKNNPSQGLMLVGGIPVVVLFCWLWWLWARRRLKFSIRIYADRVLLGHGLFCEEFAATEIEAIAEKPYFENGGAPRWLELRGQGKTRQCFLSNSSRRCGEALMSVCANAVYIDVAEKEYLPERTHEPVVVLKNLIRARRRRGILALIPGSCVFLMALLNSFLIIRVFAEKGKGELAIWIFRTSLLWVVSGIGLWYAITQFRKAASLSRKMKEHMPGGLESTATAEPVDMSELDV